MFRSMHSTESQSNRTLTLTSLTLIQEIHMADNQITELSDARLEPLLSLITLNIRGNKIRVLPEQVALLPNLERLDVTNNDLAE